MRLVWTLVRALVYVLLFAMSAADGKSFLSCMALGAFAGDAAAWFFFGFFELAERGPAFALEFLFYAFPGGWLLFHDGGIAAKAGDDPEQWTVVALACAGVFFVKTAFWVYTWAMEAEED